jgi:hypothetical protein
MAGLSGNAPTLRHGQELDDDFTGIAVGLVFSRHSFTGFSVMEAA